MKTNITLPTANPGNDKKAKANSRQRTWSFGAILLVVLLALFANKACAQRNQPKRIMSTAGLETNLSGNGHGGFYMPFAGFRTAKNEWLLGMAIQKCSMKFRGLRLSYLHPLAISGGQDGDFVNCYPGSVQFSAIGFVQYLNKITLSPNMAAVEEAVNASESVDWHTARMSTIESAAGLQVSLKIGNHFRWNNYIAGSIFYRTDYPAPMYFTRHAFVLSLGTALQVF